MQTRRCGVKKWMLGGLLVGLILGAPLQGAQKNSLLPRVELNTSMGVIVLELYPDRAPQTTANFLAYVDDRYYDGTIFHRVIPKFMIQGGGFTAEMRQKSTRQPIPNEAGNRIQNERGTIAMARTPDPHSATSQFFINTVDNDFLNFRSKDTRGWGYAVFGRVVQGMDIVDAISGVKTGAFKGYRDVPLQPVVIVTARRLK
jgi:cyclophilin family peptidyl-prolyl cis-trans isomerase